MPDYDLILKGGTVLDPRNCFDDHADLGIRDRVVEAVEPELDPARGAEVVDVSGLWVMPGQIDTHAHVAGLFGSWDPALGYAMLARAGTTTVMDMGGTGGSLIDGVKRRGAGLNVAGNFALIPGLTITDGPLSKSAIRDIVRRALRGRAVSVSRSSADTILLARRLRATSSQSRTRSARTSPFIWGQRKLEATSKV